MVTKLNHRKSNHQMKTAQIYLNFLALKILFHPLKFVGSIIRFFAQNFELKMELAPYRSRQWKKWAKY